MQVTGLVLLAAGAFLQVTSGYWDVYSHRVTFRIFDPWWNPAHISIYIGFAVALIGSLLEVRRVKLSANLALLIGPIIAIVGVAVEITAGTWNEIYHIRFTFEPPIAPAHALLTIGMIVLNLGAILGLSIRLGIAKESPLYDPRRRHVLTFSLLASYVAIWLLTAGSTMYVAWVYRDSGGYFQGAIGLAWITPMVLIPAMRGVDRFGTATSIGLGYAVVNFMMQVGYLGEEPYVPLGILSAFAFDVAYFGVKRISTPRIASMLVGILSGPLLFVTYYPFTPSISTIQWTDSLGFTLVAYTIAGLISGITGHSVVDGTRSLILNVTSRVGR